MTFTRIQVTHGYRELLGIVQMHSYYEGSVARDFEFRPTPETRDILRNYFLNFKQMPFGFLLYYHNENSPRIIDALPPKTKLTFLIQTRSPKFVNFSNIPFIGEGEALYFNNLNEDKETLDEELPTDVYYYFKNLSFGDKEKYLLHSRNHTSVNLKSALFSQQFKDNDSGERTVPYRDVTIEDAFGEQSRTEGSPYKRGLGILREKEISNFLDRERKKLVNSGIIGDALTEALEKKRESIIDELESEPLGGVQVDLRHVEFGRFTLKTGDEVENSFYTRPNPYENYFGILDIYLTGADGSLLLKHYQGQEDRYYDPQMYLINFEARETYWRYWFINYPQSKVTPLEVFEDDGKLKFTEPVESNLETLGKKAFTCETTEPVRLSEKPKHVIWLKRMQGKRPAKDIRLKVPNADMIKPYKTQDGGLKIYSDIYVYL